MRRHDRELTEKEDLRSVLDEADVCRIAINTGKAPYIVPLNFGYVWEGKLVLYFHSAGEGRKIDLLEKDPNVGFELDSGHELVTGERACNWSMRYRSLIGTGRIVFIEDEAEKKAALGAVMRKYGFVGVSSFDPAMIAKMKIYKLLVEEVTGKRKK